MPKVLIMSDSHGLTDEVEEIKARHSSDVDAMIHCGDSELDYDSKPLEHFHYAKGNCDFDPEMSDHQVVEIEGITFFVTHGHLLRIKSTLMPLYYKAKEAGAQVACFGHSHIAGAEKVEDLLLINPGSIRLPRDHKEPSYTILSWDASEQATLQYYHTDGRPMKDLKLETTLAAKE